MATKARSGAEETKPPIIPEAVTRESVAIIEKKSLSAVEIGEGITIEDDKDLEKASTFLSNLKTLQDLVKQEKDKRLNPVKEIKDWVVGIFSPIEDRIKAAETRVKRAMAEYHDNETKAAAEEQARIARQEAAGRIKPETAIRKREEVAEVKTNVKTTAGASTFSKIKKVRITDPTRVPDEYWVIDEVTLRSAALTKSKTEGKLGEVIPGAEVYEETVVSGR